jgi:hypothetical protein|tara:strand:- start:702 stop:908 length:207 start_codon:yes stop_codon:yes gene_type:complete
MSKEKKQQEVNGKTYLITSEQLMDIMRYLMTRPYGEVVNIMSKLSSLSPLDPRISAEFVKQGESNDRK